jgi:hypothetical protein
VPLPAEIDVYLTPWPVERSEKRYLARVKALGGG